MIFYFSGTGNTRWAAMQISEKTNEKLVDITKEIGKHTTYKLDEGELIGFCFPIHGWRPPLIMRKFIEQLSIENIMGHYCFALCTTGDNVGEAIKIFRKDLEKQGLHLDSAFSLIMPESYVGLPFMDVDTPVNEAKKKQKIIEIKEVRLSPNIDTNDLNTKVGAARKFISKGNKVKVTLRFRGREMAHMNSSRYILDDFAKELSDIAVVEKAPKVEGRSMTMFLTEKR